VSANSTTRATVVELGHKLYGKRGASKLRFVHHVRAFQVVED
jgi:hypothetical protein